MPGKPKTAKQYLESLPAAQRKTVEAVRKMILEHLPKGYEESITYGMLTYAVPLEVFSDTHNKQPLAVACLAAQKNYNSLHLMAIAWGNPKHRKALEDGFRKAGKRLDMGKACVRFKSVDDLPMDTIAKAIAAVPPDQYIKFYEASLAKRASR